MVTAAQTLATAESKRCRLCGAELPLTAFALNGSGGRRTECRPCHKVRYAETDRIAKARYKEEHRDDIRAKGRAYIAAYRLANPNAAKAVKRRMLERNPAYDRQRVARAYQRHPEIFRARTRAYYAAHSEQCRQSSRKSYWSDPERYRRAALQYAKRHPEVNLAVRHRRSARLRGMGGSWTAAQWLMLKEQYGYRCLMCEQREPRIKLTVDHVIPLSRGGSNTIDNLQPLCGSCNSRKHTRILDLRRKEVAK